MLLQQFVDERAHLGRAFGHAAIANFQTAGTRSARANELRSDFIDCGILLRQSRAAQSAVEMRVLVARLFLIHNKMDDERAEENSAGNERGVYGPTRFFRSGFFFMNTRNDARAAMRTKLRASYNAVTAGLTFHGGMIIKNCLRCKCAGNTQRQPRLGLDSSCIFCKILSNYGQAIVELSHIHKKKPRPSRG